MSVCRHCRKDHQFTGGKCVPLREVQLPLPVLPPVTDIRPPVTAIVPDLRTAHERKREDAGTRLRRAVALGRIVRQPCEVCGKLPSEGHHEDYDKPLEVRWLCKAHHEQAHHPNAKQRKQRNDKQYATDAARQAAYRQRRLAGPRMDRA